MGLLDSIAGRAAQAVGRTYDYLTPGAGTSTLTQLGRGIANPSTGIEAVEWAPSYAPKNAGQMVQPSGFYGEGAGLSGADRNQALAEYADQEAKINQGLGGLDEQLNVGLGNVTNSYNQSANRLDTQRGLAKRDYDTGVQGTTQSMLNSRNNVNTKVRSNMNALQRLLGIAGSGNSSAAYDAAPQAALREGTNDLQGVQQTYGGNMRKLDTGWQDTERNYMQTLEDLNNQKFQQENSLRAGIAQTRASLLDQLGGVGVNKSLLNGQNYQQALQARSPYEAQINSLLGQITKLGSQYASPVMRQNNLSFAAPSLDQYNLSRGGGVDAANPQAADVDPMLLPALPGKRDRFGNIIQ